MSALRGKAKTIQNSSLRGKTFSIEPPEYERRQALSLGLSARELAPPRSVLLILPVDSPEVSLRTATAPLAHQQFMVA